MVFIRKFFLLFASTLIFCLLPFSKSHAQFYNGYEMQFGKNRVQYDERFWSFMKFKYFDTYFYLGGLDLATYVGRNADNDLAEIEKLFDYKLDGRIQFIIYNKLSEAKQSNIGLETDELANNTGGVTRVVGNKVFLYFTGDHEDLHRQIRQGLASVLIDQIMYGGDVKDRIQNSALLSLPDWYINGLIAYIASPWNVDVDNRVRDGIVSKKYLKFNHLSGPDAIYAGHSIWKYIIDTYTESAVANLLYMTRINRNIESGLMYVLGIDMKDLSLNWSAAMKSRYENSDVGRDSITSVSIVKRPKANFYYTQLHTSPDGRYSVYIANDLGKYKIKLYDNEKKKTRRILKSGYRSYSQETDVSFPVIAWHPTGQLFSVIRERKGKLWLGTYTLETKKYVEGQLFNFEKVLDFSYSSDGQSIVLSGVQKGRTDIFVYNLRTRTYEQITKDFYDDLNPHFIDNSRGIVFSSNRTEDSLKSDSKSMSLSGNGFDIFYYDYRGKSSVLKRITETDNINETQPMQFDSSNISYLSDENGIINRHLAHIDSALSFVDTVEHYRMVVDHSVATNYPRNIQQQDVNQSHSRISEIIFRNGKYQLYVNRLSDQRQSENVQPQKTFFRNESIHNPDKKKAAAPEPVKPVVSEIISPPSQTVDSNAVDIDNYVFQSDFPKSKSKKEKKKETKIAESFTVKQDSTNTGSDSTIFRLPKQRNYETAFSSTYFVAQLDNTLLNQSYQLFTGGGAIYYNPGLNGFFKIGISDLLEDYKITGGFKLAGDLNSNEYFLSYENLKKRFDKKITFYRQVLFVDPFAKLNSHELRFQGSWPFSDVSSIRGSIAYRNDRFVVLSTDLLTLNIPNEYLNWGSGRLEYVFDNTLKTGVNLFNGTRLKIFGEYYKQINKENTGMVIIGSDVRHYQKIHREIIWANRFASATSFGKERTIFYMGSTDNWLSPKFNYETPIDYSQNYYFQALATNLRGFDQNIRNGSTFALINSELRVPIFKYLLNRPIKSDFIRNFQIVGFGDVGTAWNGTSPYDSTNALNRKVYAQSPFVITIISQNEPIVGGFGFGLRSRILGYFLRADWAWGVQNREVLNPARFYFSLGLDF
jgi:Tol biopolymer transport system component